MLITEVGLDELLAIVSMHEQDDTGQIQAGLARAAEIREARFEKLAAAQEAAGSKIAVIGIHGTIMHRWTGMFGSTSGMTRVRSSGS
jgi:ClpP class serine protease